METNLDRTVKSSVTMCSFFNREDLVLSDFQTWTWSR